MNKQLNQRIDTDGAWYINAAVKLTEELPNAPEEEKWRIESSIYTLIHLFNQKLKQHENNQRIDNGVR